jgi:hypothetical protein
MIDKICKECGNIFSIINCRSNTAKFCSVKCRGLAHIGTNNINFGKHRDLKVIEKIRNTRIYKGLNLPENNPMFNKHHNEESKMKISMIHKGKTISEKQRKEHSLIMIGTNNPMFGNHHSEETRRVWSQKRKGLLSLDKNPNWQGGISFERYGLEFDDALRDKIRERDDHTCNMCLVKDEFSNFPVHHIDYNKKNNSEKNLITLCLRCHLKTNYHRDNWKLWFSGLMFEKFKNKYQLINNERRLQTPNTWQMI